MASVRTGTLTIPNGGTESEWIELGPVTGALSLMAPPTLPEAVTVEVADVSSPADSDARALQSGGSDVTLTADKATVIDTVPFVSLRLVAGAAVGADRVFDVVEQEDYR